MSRQIDGVVIGSGPNGLVAAAYLARAGFRVLVVERLATPGGGCTTDEVTLPGFKHNLHSNFHAIEAGPVARDLDLSAHGLRYLYPEVQHTFIYRDGTAFCMYADAERTAESIRRFSAPDAERYLDIRRRLGEAMRPILRKLSFAAPMSDAELAEVIDGPSRDEFQRYRSKSLYEAVDGAFEDERIRAAFKLHLHSYALSEGPGSGHHFLRLVARSGSSGLAIGGAAALTRALVSVIETFGGSIVTGRQVDRIIVRGGRAAGVRLDDGSELQAERFILSNTDPVRTLDLAGEEWFGSELSRRVRAYRWADASLLTLHVALHEPPRYEAAAFDPAVARAFGVYFGADSSAEVAASFAAIGRGELPVRLVGKGACNTLFDPSQAPPGRHTAFWWPWAPYELRPGGAEAWDEMRDELTERMLGEWTAYAPNLGHGTVLGTYLFTPLDIERRCINMVRGSPHGGAYDRWQIDAWRPTPGLSGYRAPLDGLYLTGANSHPGGGINGASGYNAANAIAEDLGIDRWWAPAGSPEATVPR